MAYRAFDPSMAQLAELLGQHFTAYNYDRRGRGDSGDTQPFAKEREIEDLQALVEDAGGKAMVFGISSGGVLSLDAAAVTPDITKVEVYEPALIVDDSRQPVPADYTEHLTTLAAEGKRNEAIEYFLTQAVGIPAEYIGGVKQDQATWGQPCGFALRAFGGWRVARLWPAAKRSKGKPTWLTPKCSPRSSSNSLRNNTRQGVGW